MRRVAVGVLWVIGLHGGPVYAQPATQPAWEAPLEQRWKFQYDIPRRLEATKAVRDDRMAAADGPIRYELHATLLEAGFYGFLFARLNEAGQVQEVRLIRIQVVSHHTGNQSVAITPETQRDQLCGGPTMATAKWEYKPGGEGVAGGWVLISIIYGEQPMAVPGYGGRHQPQ
jgi:hypothetical protein